MPAMTPEEFAHMQAGNMAQAQHSQPHYNMDIMGLENEMGGPGRRGVSRSKAREMLEHGEVHGKPITKKQRGYFGAVASGKARK